MNCNIFQRSVAPKNRKDYLFIKGELILIFYDDALKGKKYSKRMGDTYKNGIIYN